MDPLNCYVQLLKTVQWRTFTIHLTLQLNGKPIKEKLGRWKTYIKLNKVVKDQLIVPLLQIVDEINAIKRAKDDNDRPANK